MRTTLGHHAHTPFRGGWKPEQIQTHGEHANMTQQHYRLNPWKAAQEGIKLHIKCRAAVLLQQNATDVLYVEKNGDYRFDSQS